MTRTYLYIAGLVSVWATLAAAKDPAHAAECWGLAALVGVVLALVVRGEGNRLCRDLDRQKANLLTLVRDNEAQERVLARKRAELAGLRQAGGK